MTHYRLYDSPLGEMLLRAEQDALTGVFFCGQKHHPGAPDEDSRIAVDRRAQRWLDTAAAQLAEYFGGVRQRFTVPLRPTGSAFQQRVWQALSEIPFGEVSSYGALARRLDLPAAHARAIGTAVGRNPLSVVVPCHRVLGASGALTGYAGGIVRKQALLHLEGHVMPANPFTMTGRTGPAALVVSA